MAIKFLKRYNLWSLFLDLIISFEAISKSLWKTWNLKFIFLKKFLQNACFFSVCVCVFFNHVPCSMNFWETPGTFASFWIQMASLSGSEKQPETDKSRKPGNTHSNEWRQTSPVWEGTGKWHVLTLPPYPSPGWWPGKLLWYKHKKLCFKSFVTSEYWGETIHYRGRCCGVQIELQHLASHMNIPTTVNTSDKAAEDGFPFGSTWEAQVEFQVWSSRSCWGQERNESQCMEELSRFLLLPSLSV